jgi:hypothetical protein
VCSTAPSSPPRPGWTGKYLIATSDPHISAEDAALGYKNLLEAERGFRDLKSNLLLRPIFHRLEHRIRAHVLLCWLTLLLVCVAERRTGQTWRRIATELGRVHAVALTGSAGTAPLTTAQAGIYRECGVTPPATITAIDPACFQGLPSTRSAGPSPGAAARGSCG